MERTQARRSTIDGLVGIYDRFLPQLVPTRLAVPADIVGKLRVLILTMFAGYLVAAVYYYWQAVYRAQVPV